MADKNPDRNLILKPGRPYQARYVVDLGYDTRRLTIPLRTRSLKKAREYRDVVETTLHGASRAYMGLITE